MVREEFCGLQAKELLSRFGITSPPVDVEAIASRCGLAVDYVDLPDGFSGQLRRERRVIQVNQAHHPHRQRWTIAHELGHYVLGHDTVLFVGDTQELGDPRKFNDREADMFAANLLMPAEWIKDDWKTTNNYKDLARLYWVSGEAMTRRLLALKLLD